MFEPIRFRVFGKPQPGGSKSSFVPTNKKTGQPFRGAAGRIIVNTVDSNPNVKDWKKEVRACAAAAYRGAPRADALTLKICFYVERPKSHYGSGKNSEKLKDSAPLFPATKPDCTKLTRGTEDALIGVIYVDDSQVVNQHIYKRYGNPGAEIEISEATV